MLFKKCYYIRSYLDNYHGGLSTELKTTEVYMTNLNAVKSVSRRAIKKAPNIFQTSLENIFSQLSDTELVNKYCALRDEKTYSDVYADKKAEMQLVVRRLLNKRNVDY